MPRDVHGDLLRRFRRQTERTRLPRLPLSRREHYILAALSIVLVSGTWLRSGYPLWAQWVLLGSVVIAVATLFIPVGNESHLHYRSLTGRENWRRLMNFPVFWIGLALVIYIVIQNVNPASSYESLGGSGNWKMAPRDYIRWLPAGTETPIRIYDGWRHLLMVGCVWASICVVWAGFRRPRAIRIFLWIFIISLVIWAGIAITQVIANAPGILWTWESPIVLRMHQDPVTGKIIRETAFFGLTNNANHGAALLNIGIVAAGAAFLLYLERSRQVFANGGPHLLLILFLVVLAGAVVLSVSRGAVGIACLIIVLFIIILAQMVLRHWREIGNPVAGIAVAIGLIVIIWGLISQIDWRRVQYRLSQTHRLIEDPKSDLRYHLLQGTMLMIKDRWLFGWGAGAYRYVIHNYDDRVPGLNVTMYQAYWDASEGRMKRQPYRAAIGHAHNDYLQWLAELGVVGALMIALFVLYVIWKLIKLRRQLSAAWAFLFLGLAVIAMHATVEFIFHIPATLLAWGMLGAIGLRYLESHAHYTPRGIGTEYGKSGSEQAISRL